MKLKPVILLIAVFLCSGSISWADDAKPSRADELKKLVSSGFKDSEIKDITANIHSAFVKRKKSNQKIVFTHGFDITLVMLKDSSWTEQVITKRMARVMEIYGQCGIMISKAKLVMTIAPFSMGADLSARQALALNKWFPLESNNVMYFQQKDVGEYDLAYAFRIGKKALGGIYNRSFITWVVATNKYAQQKKKAGIDIWEEAHELAHILLNESHPSIQEKANLLNGGNAKTVKNWGTLLNENQCDKIRIDPDGVGIVKRLERGPFQFEVMSELEAQKRLTNLGFNLGKPDGIWGKKSTQALNEFRASKGLEASTELDLKSQNLLRNAFN